MNGTFKTAWLSDVVDIIDKPETNRIVCHGKEFVLVKHGHWINHFNDLFPADGNVECSVCHEYEGIMVNDNYCPNCGARMDEVEERLTMPKADGSTIPKDYMAR